MTKPVDVNGIPYDKLKSLYKGVCEANTALHKQIIDMQNELQYRKQMERKLTAEKIAQDSIMQHSVGEFNRQKEALLKDNQLLREQIQRMKDGSVD